jgi:hypothetical protein
VRRAARRYLREIQQGKQIKGIVIEVTEVGYFVPRFGVRRW